jgi:hypothetical protein
MPANDREVFEFLKADQETAVEIDFLTFAIFAHERQQWCELFEKQNGHQPKPPAAPPDSPPSQNGPLPKSN